LPVGDERTGESDQRRPKAGLESGDLKARGQAKGGAVGLEIWSGGERTGEGRPRGKGEWATGLGFQ